MKFIEMDNIKDITERYDLFNKKCLKLLLIIDSFKKKEDNNKIISLYIHEIVSFITPFFYYNESEKNNKFIDSIKNENKKYKNSKGFKNLIFKFIEFINYLIHGKHKKNIYINNNVDKFTRRKLIFRWFFKYRIIFINRFEREDLLREHKNVLEILLNSIYNSFPKEIHPDYFENFISKLYLLKINSSTTLPSIFVTGSNMNIDSRIMSYYFQKHHKKVLSISHHKNSLFVYNEPWVQYAELAFVDKYVNHGKKEIENNDCQILLADNSNVKKRKTGKIKYPNTLLYIPTSLSGYSNYGPYRSFFDEDYKIIQKLIIDNSKAQGLDLHIKQHPKQKKIFDTGDSISRFEFLEEVIDEYEYVLLDYISNASQLCIEKKKTIFYIDYSIRNINACFLEDMKSSIAGFYTINLDSELVTAFNSINTIILNKGKGKKEYSKLEDYFKNEKTKLQTIDEAI